MCPTPGSGPEPPQGPISVSQRDRYGRALAGSICARTAPVLLSKDEVLAALDVKRIPVDLPSTKTDGRVVYRCADPLGGRDVAADRSRAEVSLLRTCVAFRVGRD